MNENKPECTPENSAGKIPLKRLVIPWIAVSDELPTQCRKVLATYRNTLNNGRIIIAERYESASVECDCEFACNCEYDEKRDGHYLPAGWYGVTENHEEFGLMMVSDKITHWSPLPRLPLVV